jgi:hypothetical protein
MVDAVLTSLPLVALMLHLAKLLLKYLDNKVSKILYMSLELDIACNSAVISQCLKKRLSGKCTVTSMTTINTTLLLK